MADYGIKISKSGQDVRHAVDTDLAFSSEFNSFKLSSSTLNGTALTQAISGTSGTTITVSHNLGYQPSFLAWAKNELGEWRFYTSMGFDLGTANLKMFYNSSGTNTLRLNFNNIGALGTISYHYVIAHDGF